MGRKRRSQTLNVIIGSTQVGSYTRSANGATSFQYDHTWLASEKAFAISLSLPLSDRKWSGLSVKSFFDGMLPDDLQIRNKIAARESAESSNSFDLLAVIGRDCVGALQFIPEGEKPTSPSLMQYQAISSTEIAKRIAKLGTSPLGIDSEADFRISIAGVQEKTAFLKIDHQWQIPIGATPTSHIFKPAMNNPHADFSDSPWNEWFCLLLCRELGLETANSRVELFDDKPVLVVERFDRLWKNNILYRLPQEDLCQALGIAPEFKYQSEGGPSITDIMTLLNGSSTPLDDRISFFKTQIIFWLMAAIDGHAKNYSLSLTPGGYKLTPLYDVMSVAPYPEMSSHKIKMALAFGHKNYYKLKQIQVRHIFQSAEKSGLNKQWVEQIITDILNTVDGALSKTIAQAIKTDMPESTINAISNQIQMQLKKLKG